VERAFNRSRGRAARQAIVDGVDQHADAKHVRTQDEFLALVVAYLAGAGEEVDRLEPFGVGRLDFAHEGMQVLDQGLHDLFQARVRDRFPALHNNVGQVFFGDVGHSIPPFAVAAKNWSDMGIRPRPAEINRSKKPNDRAVPPSPPAEVGRMT
jgi:hypothetical protein